jgi:hypothetical protein
MSLGSIAFAVVTPAATLFTIDPNQTLITLSGSALGTTMTEQGPGSLVTKFSGTVNVEMTATGIRFPGGSLVDGSTNGVWEPLANGAAGSAPADFGGKVSSFVMNGKAAIRNVLLDLTSPEIAITGDQFNASGLVFAFLTNSAGSLDYTVSSLLGGQTGSRVLDGLATNNVVTTGTISNAANGSVTLILPIDATSYQTLLAPGDVVLTVRGQLVAHASAAASPTLRIEAVGSQIVLAWPLDAGTNAIVQTTTNFSGWGDASGTLSVGPEEVRWSTDATNPFSFYRLQSGP